MQVSLDGCVKYCGHENIEYKDGRRYVILSVVDEEQVPYQLFCPGTVEAAVRNLPFGSELSIIFKVNRFRNNLDLRVSEVIGHVV